MDWSLNNPPDIDFGPPVEELSFNGIANCETSGLLHTLFAGWTDQNPFSISVSVVLSDTEYPTMADLAGKALHPGDFASDMVLHLDVGEAAEHYGANLSETSVLLFDFVENVRWSACVYGHGNVLRHTGSNQVIQVPDPLLFVCE